MAQPNRLGSGVAGEAVVVAVPAVDAGLYSALREAHSVLAFVLVAVVAAHVSAVLLHAITLRDGIILRRMAFRLPSTLDRTRQTWRDQLAATLSRDGTR